MTETELLNAILRRAAELNVLAFHSGDSKRDVGPGFPDLVLVGRSGHVFVELKSNDGQISPEQRRWANRLYDVGLSCSGECQAGHTLWMLWRPVDWDRGICERALEALARPAPVPAAGRPVYPS